MNTFQCLWVISVVALSATGAVSHGAVGTPVAAERYWVNGDGAWSDAGHWSAESGGTAGAGVPNSEQDAVFDAESGAARVLVDVPVEVRDLHVGSDVHAQFQLAMGSSPVTCRRDCLLLGGTLDQGQRPYSRLTVWRNLDTSGCLWRAKGNMSVHLPGTGWWRYRLGKKTKPSVWDFLAAQPGQTTTLRPVDVAPRGIDIDVENQCLFGDKTALLTMDKSEATNRQATVTIEIHSTQAALDIVADGCTIRIDCLEHEMKGKGHGRLQNKLRFDGLQIYDVTGAFRAPEGTGPEWTLEGPLDLGEARLSIEKTCVFNTGGHALTAGQVTIGMSGYGELRVETGTVTIDRGVRLGNAEFSSKISLGSGSLRCASLQIGNAASSVEGTVDARLLVNEVINEAGALLQVQPVSRARGGQPF